MNRIEPITYNGWADAIRVTNRTVDMVVVPSVARVMRYGFVGGPNVLWENPQASGKSIPLNTWPNTGGDKVWIWPQSDWPQIIGRSFPAPPAADQAPHQAEVIGDTVRLTSPPVVPWGLRIVRDITVAPTGTEVVLRSRFVAYRNSPFPVGVWTITQIPPDAPVYLRLMPRPTTNDLPDPFRVLANGAGKTVLVAPSLLRTERPTPTADAYKIGANGNLLASVRHGALFVVEALHAAESGITAPGEAAQVYGQPDDANALKLGTTGYYELELTSPVTTLRKNETLTLTTRYTLQNSHRAKRPKPSSSPAKCAVVVMQGFRRWYGRWYG